DDPTQLLVLPVTCNFFSLYGLDRPKLGRWFREDECARPGSSPVAVISEEVWRDRFGSDPRIVGSEVRLNHAPFTIVGVTPARFAGQLRGPGIYVPYTMQASFFGGHDFFRESSTAWLVVEGRLKAGESRATAAAELAVIEHQQDQLERGRVTKIFVTNGSFMEEPGQSTVWLAPLVIGALLLILLLACTNVTTLLLSRAAARQQEIAIRLSLGASRKRLLRMLMTESLILAGAAGAISAWIAARVPSTMETLIPGMPHYPLRPDFTVFAYLAAITLLAGIIAGMAPAIESLKVDLTSSLKGQTGFFGSARSKGRGLLVGAQVAMSLVLLAGAGLFVRAEMTVFSQNPGFETQQVFQFFLRTPAPQYTPASAAAFLGTFAGRLREIPGVRTVAFTSSPPYSNDEGGGPAEEILLAGQVKGAGRRVAVNVVSPGFFDALSNPIVRGRAFRDGEIPVKGVAEPVVISEAMVRLLWPGKDPLGQIAYETDGHPLEVVGVARDVKSLRFGAVDGPLLYGLPAAGSYGGWIIARFDGDAKPVQAAIRDLVRGMDREMMPRIETLQSSMDGYAAIFWKAAEIVLGLGAIALLLAVVGIYGVVAFAVDRRSREIGIRMALGATRGEILRSVIASGVRPIAIGLAVGMALAIGGAVVLAQALKASPVSLNVSDPAAYVAVSVVLMVTALAAMFGPAFRASRADPVRALRQD
ncbi:MAG TPA: FtsX-like permease family protein, partial [Bryobacteraceae bacterium]|nr:FtsX-like permease family protein [Bryobacteraceae bacterium]